LGAGLNRVVDGPVIPLRLLQVTRKTILFQTYVTCAMAPTKDQKAPGVGKANQVPINAAGSNGRCNTIWYKAVFKGGVYETRETVWVFGGAEIRRVASLEGKADAA